jgi:PPOX class probable F420-dependent enzyme
MAVAIPESHKHLLLDPIVVALVTMMPNGQPQATPVWVDYDGTYVIVNTARGRQKDKNMSPGAKVTVLSINPKNHYNWLEVRGVIAEEDEASGLEVINRLSLKYRGNPDYFTANPELRGVQQRVTYRIEPTHVNASKG